MFKRIFNGPRAFVLMLLLGVVSVRAADKPVFVWWEGEAAVWSNLPKVSDFAPDSFPQRANLLSGGDWLNSKGIAGAEAPAARWKVSVPTDGSYHFYVRKFWKHGPFHWRFDCMPAGEMGECPKDVGLLDERQLKPLVSANWVSLGPVTLLAGERTLDVQLLVEPGSEFICGIDCFVLTKEPFVPNGLVKPGELLGQADDGFFAFEPGLDPFRDDALIDLRSLNETSAGQGGFLRRQGKQILLGDGKPVRFWAVNVRPENIRGDRESVDYLARKLAKLGVNMVRFHGPLFDAKDPAKLDLKTVDQLMYLVGALKKQGIYTTLSFYFPIWVDGQKLGLDGFDAQKNKVPFSLLFFDAKLQALHRGWMKQLLTAPNPYTGVPMAREPAVGIVEIQNEDSLFFWTFAKTNVPQVQWNRLEDLFNAWLSRKYGSVPAAFQAWSQEAVRGDTADHALLYEIYHLTTAGLKQGGAGKTRRAGDQTQFMAELQRAFYDGAIGYLKKDLNFGGLAIASNWITADQATLGTVERWTYAGGDVIDAHGYYEPEHKGDGASYSVRVGHTVKDRAAVANVGLSPLRYQQIDGYPQITSELGFTQPSSFRAEGTFLSSAYGALQGLDGIYFFTIGSNYVLDQSIQKFQLCSPAGAFTFPAAAMVYRQGLVKEAEPSIYQVTPTSELWTMKSSGNWTPALDSFRLRDVPPGAPVAGPVERINGYSPYVGPVVRAYSGEPAAGYQRDFARYINRQDKVILSLTGELRWDYGKGLVTINAPSAQGAGGFLKGAGPIQLAYLKISMENDFATVTAVALDGKPVDTSRKVLLQVMTDDQPYGFKVEKGVVASIGNGPFEVRRIAGKIQLKSEDNAGAKVVAVDPNGYASQRQIKVETSKEGINLSLEPDVIHYLITR